MLLKAADKLERGSESLDLVACGGSLAINEAWAEWERDYKMWRGDLDQWLIFASPYLDVGGVNKLPDNIHRLHWAFGDNQFPKSAAIHDYRAFCVIHHNWTEIRDRVHACVRKVAFEGELPLNAKISE